VARLIAAAEWRALEKVLLGNETPVSIDSPQCFRDEQNWRIHLAVRTAHREARRRYEEVSK
jgi:hypothetical protein